MVHIVYLKIELNVSYNFDFIYNKLLKIVNLSKKIKRLQRKNSLISQGASLVAGAGLEPATFGL